MTGIPRGWRAVMAAAACVLLLTGCRQPEGAAPVPTGDQPNRIDDVSRDLLNVARKDPNGPAELFDDLSNMDSAAPRPPERVKALAQALSTAVGGRTLAEADARRIAEVLFVALVPGNLNADQIEQNGTALRDALVQVGATTEQADQASGAAIAVANDVTSNQKRWYQR